MKANRKLSDEKGHSAQAAAEGLVQVDGVEVQLTHLDKVYFPDGTTKGDLLTYNADVAELLLPYLRDRPYTMKRCPDGIEGECFFQKDVGKFAPKWLPVADVPSQGKRATVRFMLCNNRAALMYAVNAGCIDHNVWMSRAGRPDAPDFTLLDLDPGPNAGFGKVVRVAVAIGRVLDEAGIAGYPKTSGASGMHIWIPIAAGETFSASAGLAEAILRAAAARVPELATDVWQVARRPPDRVYLDYRQNAKGKTIPPPYSPRPVTGAHVSAPLKWSEINPKLDPAAFTIRTMGRRLDKYGDLFAPVLKASGRPSVASLLRRLSKAA